MRPVARVRSGQRPRMFRTDPGFTSPVRRMPGHRIPSDGGRAAMPALPHAEITISRRHWHEATDSQGHPAVGRDRGDRGAGPDGRPWGHGGRHLQQAVDRDRRRQPGHRGPDQAGRAVVLLAAVRHQDVARRAGRGQRDDLLRSGRHPGRRQHRDRRRGPAQLPRLLLADDRHQAVARGGRGRVVHDVLGAHGGLEWRLLAGRRRRAAQLAEVLLAADRRRNRGTWRR